MSGIYYPRGNLELQFTIYGLPVNSEELIGLVVFFHFDDHLPRGAC